MKSPIRFLMCFALAACALSSQAAYTNAHQPDAVTDNQSIDVSGWNESADLYSQIMRHAYDADSPAVGSEPVKQNTLFDDMAEGLPSPEAIFIAISILIVLLAIVDLGTFASSNFIFTGYRHVNTKALIVTFGILGTFLGLVHSLYALKTPGDPIQGSEQFAEQIARLIEGLEEAFWTTIVAFIVSLGIAIIEKVCSAFIPSKSTNALLEEMNAGLSRSLDDISKGATDQIVTALEGIVKKFNEALVEQFGANFAKLNDACEKLVIWQQQHLDLVEKSTDMFAKLNDALDKISKVHEELNEKITAWQPIAEKIAAQMEAIEARTKQMSDTISGFEKLPDDFSRSLQEMKNTNQSAIDSLSTLHTNTLAQIKDASDKSASLLSEIQNEVRGLIHDMKDGNKQSQDAINKQRQEMSKLSNELEQSVVKMDQTFAEITRAHGKHYREVLDRLTEAGTELLNIFAEIRQRSKDRKD